MTEIEEGFAANNGLVESGFRRCGHEIRRFLLLPRLAEGYTFRE
jgi:hypothetical protein